MGTIENLDSLQTKIILDNKFAAKVTEEEMLALCDAKRIIKNPAVLLCTAGCESSEKDK